ncbi:MAG: hypothetical protein Q8J63_04290 [Candidatus Aquicultor sp.]|nr:hypothetical protein [Candidatus Aquicultor sp.]
MSRFVIDRFKGRVAHGVVMAEFAGDKATLTGYDAKSAREIEFLLRKEYSIPQHVTSGANALTVSMAVPLEPGSEEHFEAVMQALPDYGFLARRIG